VRSQTRTILSRALTTVSGDAAKAEPAVREAVSAIDVAVRKGVMHANTAARTKSRLLKRFNLAQANAVVAAAAAGTASEPAPKAPTRRTAAKKPEAAAEKPAAKAPSRRAAPKAKAEAEEKPAPRTRTRKTT
jgi:small subunit ribosomal protein S20